MQIKKRKISPSKINTWEVSGDNPPLETRTERENTRSDRGLYLRRKPLSYTLYVETPAPRKGGGNHGGNVRGCFLNKGRNAHGRSRHAIAVSYPGSRLPKSPRIAAIPSARYPFSHRLYCFQRCPWSFCQGRKTSASPPLFFQRPFPALTCTQHAGSLRHLPKPTARVLHRKAPAVWTRTAAQDSSGAWKKKELPIGTTLSEIKPRTIGSSKI